MPVERPASARERLLDDGVVVLRGLLSAAWCARLHAAIDRCRAEPGPHYGVLSPPGSVRVDSDLFRWRDDPDIYAVTHASGLPDAAADLLGERDVVLIEDQWFASEPGATTPSPWHQDEPYYRLDRPFLTIWVTLDDITADASLRVVPGSHLGTIYAPVEFSATSATIERGDALEPVPDVDDAGLEVWSWDLAAGDAIALDSRALHATGRGALDRPFRRFSTRWASPQIRYRNRPTGTATFWDVLAPELRDGDAIVGEVFPLISPVS